MTDQETKEAWKERYRNGAFLAPMVRVGTLPMRLLALEYGADLVWTPEIVDKSIAGCERIVDEKTGVIRYEKNGHDIFTTHPKEHSQVVFQLGSAAPETAIAAAKTIENDVSGVDLNCGCPMPFSVQGGMGAALLSDPDRLCSILEALVANVNIPVTCKIRILNEEEPTLELVRKIAKTGISALTVHCRTKTMRPRERALWHRINSIVKELPDIPIILNGDILEYDDIARAREKTGATSVMAARGAIENPSMFRKEGPLMQLDMNREYVKTAIRTSNSFSNTKYTLLQMYPYTKSKQFVTLRSAKSYLEMCEGFELGDFYHSEGAKLINPRADPRANKLQSRHGKKRQHESIQSHRGSNSQNVKTHNPISCTSKAPVPIENESVHHDECQSKKAKMCTKDTLAVTDS